MRHQVVECFLLISLVIPSLLFISATYSRSMIEPCKTSDSCPSLLSYLVPYDSKLSEIAYRFQVNVLDILGANSINVPTNTQLDSLENQIVRAKSLIKVPISCPCVDGIRRSLSTAYVVKPADTLDSISEGFGGLVSDEQIRSVNGIISKKNPLVSGESLVIPLPCICFNNSNNGVVSVYMAYVVQRGESLGDICREFGTTVSDLEAVNGLEQPLIDPGDILQLPIPACSSANLNWYNESLVVPNGSYALTASNCIKCICGPTHLNLLCLPSRMEASCSHLQCKGSDLFVGDSYVSQTPIGCNITTCLYRGHKGGKIFRSLSNSSYVKCPEAGSQSNYADSPMASPSVNPMVPFVTLSPSPSPSSSAYSNPTTGNKQNSDISSDGKLLTGPFVFYITNLLPLGLAFCFIL
ncbi:hypothetical protein Q3G72_010390 [Acer saccharum]|nr:hypothetical protein Q3G72_010390 [Acer saccharum]